MKVLLLTIFTIISARVERVWLVSVEAALRESPITMTTELNLLNFLVVVMLATSIVQTMDRSVNFLIFQKNHLNTALEYICQDSCTVSHDWNAHFLFEFSVVYFDLISKFHAFINWLNNALALWGLSTSRGAL